MADDHPLILEGIRRVLEPDVDLVGVAHDKRSLVAAAAELRPDVVLLDVAAPRLGGMAAVRQLRRRMPSLKLVFITAHGDAASVGEAQRAGALGFVLKRSAVSELPTAVREAVHGRFFASPAAGTPARRARPVTPLTPRQREVLELVANGRTAKEIASALGVSIKTAEFHKSAVMNRLGLHTVAELTKFAVRHRISES